MNCQVCIFSKLLRKLPSNEALYCTNLNDVDSGVPSCIFKIEELLGVPVSIIIMV